MTWNLNSRNFRCCIWDLFFKNSTKSVLHMYFRRNSIITALTFSSARKKSFINKKCLKIDIINQAQNPTVLCLLFFIMFAISIGCRKSIYTNKVLRALSIGILLYVYKINIKWTFNTFSQEHLTHFLKCLLSKFHVIITNLLHISLSWENLVASRNLYLRHPFSSAPDLSGQSCRPSQRRTTSMQLPLSQRNWPVGQTMPAEEFFWMFF